MLQYMGSQKVKQDLVTEQQQSLFITLCFICMALYFDFIRYSVLLLFSFSAICAAVQKHIFLGAQPPLLSSPHIYTWILAKL